MRLKDKVAIITAAGSGQGRAGAVRFAREGAKVVVGDIDAKAANDTVRMIKEGGGEAISVQIDAGKVSDISKLIETAVNAFGKLNILWNHAGIPGPGLLEDTEEKEFDRAMAVNVKGGFFATKFAVPHLKKAGGGAIIFTASTAALRPSPFSPSYGLAKGGIANLTYSLAVFLGPHNIRVNCICPGLIDTPMARDFMDRTGRMKSEDREKAVKEYIKKSALNRIGKPEDIANAALFLASDEASFITGVVIPVDGGRTVKS